MNRKLVIHEVVPSESPITVNSLSRMSNLLPMTMPCHGATKRASLNGQSSITPAPPWVIASRVFDEDPRRLQRQFLDQLRPGQVSGLDKGSDAHRQQWLRQTLRALEQLAIWAGGFDRLAVENLEGYALDFIEPVVDRLPVSRCVDVGHLWLDGHDPIPYLQAALPRTRVIHMHGIAERDHRSLKFMPFEKVCDVWKELIASNYEGVLTLEIFSEEDFVSSLEVIEKIV